jgi:hypothetical protein
MKNKFIFAAFIAMSSCLWAQAIRDNSNSESQVPLKKVVILTSGLAYYEHSGRVNGSVSIRFPFRTDAVNDALKSLVINDPSSANPSVNYQSEQTLKQTLRSLKIDLSDNPDLSAILLRLKGSEVEIFTPSPISGRIMGIEQQSVSNSFFSDSEEPWLLLNTSQGLKRFNLKEINSINFKDPAIEQDLNRALDLIAVSGNLRSRELLVILPGSGGRNVSVSYVIPSPVWKVSYRLDLGASKPLFQGWAIVDNDSDTDWNNIELSLVAGRPVSFVQNLYPPYYVSRPVLPLSIAGTARALSHDQGYSLNYSGSAYDSAAQSAARPRENPLLAESFERDEVLNSVRAAKSSENIAGGLDTASGSEAGGQFEFTIKTPVNLDRQMSAMLPLVESVIGANKLIIFTGGKHPRLGAELTNTSGMKLPAGPVTVYDGGVYAGDALLEFWNENEKRLISFGEDLSVTSVTGDTSTRAVSSVTVAGGVMTINRSLTYTKTYTFKNSGSVSKQLIIEHSKTPQTNLVSPKADEDTASGYRFSMTLPANKEAVLTVDEQRPLSETVRLLSINTDSFLSYSTNQEIPARVREALQRAVELKRISETADQKVKELENQQSRLASDQDRIRRNLEAAGNQTQQGQEYLKRLVALDSEIDAISPALEKANNEAKAAKEAWEKYLNGLNL